MLFPSGILRPLCHAFRHQRLRVVLRGVQSVLKPNSRAQPRPFFWRQSSWDPYAWSLGSTDGSPYMVACLTIASIPAMSLGGTALLGCSAYLGDNDALRTK